ncbi:hypothetical protein [Williamsia muralis]|uniref:Uncharacterized protein n=1 Tax=Williamsia marianensis TaxID=85044 RepID=A0A2G3PL35_WILMA|nr:hypothetical protein [Williamsia marianensis]PHV66535.1 hypothetical protein CSW57_09460 [Williamsia marianensis]
MGDNNVQYLAGHSLLLAAPAFFPALILVIVIVVIAVRDRRRGDDDGSGLEGDVERDSIEKDGDEYVRDDGDAGDARG